MESKKKIRRYYMKRTGYQLFCKFVFDDLMTVSLNEEYPPSKDMQRAIDKVANFVGDIAWKRIKPKTK